MNALLLSAGEGTRLRPLTLETPKCLLPLIDDKPLLQYWLDTLVEIGIETIFINVFHLKDKIAKYISSQHENIANRVYIYKEETLEPIGMVLNNLKHLLGSPFLIINSDTYINKSDVKKFVGMAGSFSVYPIILGTDYRKNTKDKSRVIIDSYGMVTKFIEKPEDDMPGYSYAGIMLMDTSVINNDVFKKELCQDILPDFKNKMMTIEISNVIDIGDSLETYYQSYERFGKKRK